jgi:hypothetical protein
VTPDLSPEPARYLMRCTALALAWLYTGAKAFSAARQRDFVAHRRWMIRNFSLTFAAVTLRLYLPPVFIFPRMTTDVMRALVIGRPGEKDSHVSC